MSASEVADLVEVLESDEQVKLCFVVHESFRRLGFLPKEIFVGYAENTVYVELRTQGKTFVVTVGPSQHDYTEFFRRWNLLAHNIKKLDHAVIEKIWVESELGRDADAFVALTLKLTDKGIEIPNLPITNRTPRSDLN